MRMRFKQIFIISVVVVFVAVLACKPSHPRIQDFARDLAKELTMLVCKGKYDPNPCGDKDVRFEADSFRTVYINVYGVVDENEIRSLVDFTLSFHRGEYRVIPIVMTFYANLRKPNTLKNPKIVYEITLKGGK